MATAPNSTFTDSNSKKYSIQNLSYPMDIEGSTQYGSHKVVFFINVSTEGRIGKAAGGNTNSTLYDVPKEDQRVLSGTAAVDGAAKTLGAGIENVNNAAGSAGSVVGLDTKMDASTVTSIQNGLSSLNSGNMKRLTSAICLHMPNSVRSSWSVSWGEADIKELSEGIIGPAGTQAATAAMAVDGFGNKAVAGGTTLASAAIARRLAGEKYLSRATKTTQSNSKSEQLFQAVDFREFEFSYFFSPKNRDEADNVLKIIRMFRHHMLPEFKDTSQFMFIYPSEFNVKYYFGAAENPHLEKQMTAVLTRLNVDYTPNGQYNAFEDGMPQQINMTMTFKEIGIVTKETAPESDQGL
jgi:hypothetical protein